MYNNFFGSKLFLPIRTTFIYATYLLPVTLLKAPVWISGCCFGGCVGLCVSVTVVFLFLHLPKDDRNQLCRWVKDIDADCFMEMAVVNLSFIYGLLSMIC